MQPGDTISPSPEEKNTPQVVSAEPPQTEQEQSFYKVDEPSGEPESRLEPSTQSDVAWTASEYVDHQKTGGWYLLLGGATVVVIVLVYFLTSGDIVAVSVIAIAAVLFGIVAARKPRTLHYEVGRTGITIGDKQYPFADFKTFSLVTETTIHSVQLSPLKRFMPPLSIYFPPDMEDTITQALGQYLPYAEQGHDVFDRFMSRIRF